MIKIKNASILDILPHTFLTDEGRATAAAIKRLTGELYTKFAALLFWGDIENASPIVLDALARELDCPFYSDDLSDDQKRSMIAATFEYNERIGTVSSITGLLAGAFGNGIVHEWNEYSGDPYHFRAEVFSAADMQITSGGYELLQSKIDDVKPKRAKLDGVTITRSLDNDIYAGMFYFKKTKRFVVPAAQLPDTERGYQ